MTRTNTKSPARNLRARCSRVSLAWTSGSLKRFGPAIVAGFLLLCPSVLSGHGKTRGSDLEAATGRSSPHGVQSSAQPYGTRELRLPGANGLVTLDYFAWDRSTGRLWVPAGNLAGVAAINGKTDEISMITGFQTAETELRGRRVRFGPSSVSIGDGVVYIGSRADSSICLIDARTLKLGNCIPIASASDGLSAAPDGVVYVATSKELWVTRGAPPIGIPSKDQALTILDASDSTLKMKTKIPLAGSAEGYAVDEKRGLFYTNLAESKETLAIDVRRREIVSRWRSGCDEPRGLALDRQRRILFVACSDRVVSLDAGGDGRVLGDISTGDGLDNIDYAESERILYAAASKVATLTIARVDDRGSLNRIAIVPTSVGARGVIAGETGTAYVADPLGGRILKVSKQ